eukprot:2458605-Pyramimonas_sp.AAC.2
MACYMMVQGPYKTAHWRCRAAAPVSKSWTLRGGRRRHRRRRRRRRSSSSSSSSVGGIVRTGPASSCDQTLRASLVTRACRQNAFSCDASLCFLSGRPLAPKRSPGGLQEVAKRPPRGPQEVSKRPPRGPQEVQNSVVGRRSSVVVVGRSSSSSSSASSSSSSSSSVVVAARRRRRRRR